MNDNFKILLLVIKDYFSLDNIGLILLSIISFIVCIYSIIALKKAHGGQFTAFFCLLLGGFTLLILPTFIPLFVYVMWNFQVSTGVITQESLVLVASRLNEYTTIFNFAVNPEDVFNIIKFLACFLTASYSVGLLIISPYYKKIGKVALSVAWIFGYQFFILGIVILAIIAIIASPFIVLFVLLGVLKIAMGNYIKAYRNNIKVNVK